MQVANRIQKLYEKKSMCDVQVGFIPRIYWFNMWEQSLQST